MTFFSAESETKKIINILMNVIEDLSSSSKKLVSSPSNDSVLINDKKIQQHQSHFFNYSLFQFQMHVLALVPFDALSFYGKTNLTSDTGAPK